VRFNDEGSRLVVVAHLGPGYLGGYKIPCWPLDGHWHEWTRDYHIDIDGGIGEVELSSFDVHVFKYEPS
jgi:1,4-alpha-glucan branching enzyme